MPGDFSINTDSHQEYTVDKFKDILDEALAALATEKREALSALLGLESPTIAQVEEAEALAVEVDEIDTETQARATAAQEAGDKFKALRDRFAAKPEGEEGDEPAADEADDADEDEADADDEGDEPKVEVETEDATTKVNARTSGVATLARKSKRPVAPKSARQGISITAAADVPQFASGQSMEGLEQVAQAVINRARGFGTPSGTGETVSLQQFGTAMFALDFDDDLQIDRMEDAQEVMERAANEHRLPGGSLVASGGWCAPSETVYDLSQDATTEGMLSLPEVAVKRGGIRYAQSPTFSDFYANPGFIQTETQAIAGTTKPCVEVTCPTFTEVRLDAEGICIKVPILTNAAYPEVVANFISGTMIAHQHWINANVIGRLVTAAGTARVFAGLGSTVSDTLEALELVINQTRQKYRLSLNASMEVILPFWVKGAMRADLGRRAERPAATVTDQEMMAHFASIGANVQFVYDWQNINETANAYPTTYQALVYPAGTFVKGTAPVINLNTVYDAASLAVNTYTGLFAEQGLLVAKMKFGANLLTLPICNAGRLGALNLTCA